VPDSKVEGWDLLFWSVFAALIALNLMPVWVTDILPVLDSPPHQHLITILHEYGGSATYQHYYDEVDVIVPYITYYKVVNWLAWLGGVEWAHRVALSLVLAMLPVSALHLLRTLGHNRWLVLGVFPWALSGDFFLGFFNYLMSIPFFLWLLAAHLRFLRQRTWKNAALVAGLMMLLAVTHYLLWAISLCLLPLMAVVMGWRVGRRRALLWPLGEAALCLPSIGLLVPWFWSYFVKADTGRTGDLVLAASGSIMARLQGLYAGNHLTPLSNLEQLFQRMFNQFMLKSGSISSPLDLLVNRPGELLSALWLLGLGLWVLVVIRQRGRDDPPRPALDGTVYAGAALVLVALAYFHLPQHLSRPIYLYGVNFRLIEVLAVMSVVALPLRPFSPRPSLRVPVGIGTALLAVVAVLMPLQTAGAFMLARTEMGSIRQAYGTIPPDRTVLTLRWRRHSRYLKEPVFTGIGEYYAVFQGGYVPYSFADSSSKPLLRNAETALPCPVWFDHGTFSMKAHGRFYDYIVIYRPQEEGPGAWERSLRSWERIYRRDRWQVFRNPQPAEWPRPSEAELARRQRIDDAANAMLRGIGLHESEPEESGLQTLLKLLLTSPPPAEETAK